MNPCPCGYLGDDRKPCTCSMSAVQRYRQRINGPLMERVDIHLEMVRVPFQKLVSLDAGESSSAIRSRVETARKVQEARFCKWGKPGVMVNGDMGPAEVQQFCAIDEAGRNLIRAAMQQMNLSPRAYHRILRLGRTIADLAGEESVQVHHLAEALQLPGCGRSGEIGWHSITLV